VITEYIIKKVLDNAIDAAKTVTRKSRVKFLAARYDIEKSIDIHLKAVKNWSEEISFSDLKKAKRTTDIYIELDLYVYPRRIRMNTDEQIVNIPLLDIFKDYHNHFVLLGHPGAGKTTSMKFLCQELFYNEHFEPERFAFPILIKLRDLNTKDALGTSITDTILNLLGIQIEFPEDMGGKEASADRKVLREKLAVSVLEGLNVLLILDGFDEIAQSTRRKEVISEIRYLVEHLDKSTVIVTSRTGDFKYNVEGMVPYEISPLTREQISTFASKWLNGDAQAADFLNKVYESPFADTAIRPLTLAHLCAIYEREGKIPDKPKSIYRKIINLLLEEWDQQRSVKRESSYAQFEIDRKFEFLCRLAYELTVTFRRTVFTTSHLLQIYRRICADFNLGTHEAADVVSELESHTGLIIQSGYEQYEFAHKSLQEFLTAEYLVKLPSIPAEMEVLTKLPYELAVATTISSNPSAYFSELVIYRLRNLMLSEEFVRSFVGRLLIEKPDFSDSNTLGLALINLYSVYIKWNVLSKGRQGRLFYFDSVIVEFERLIQIVLRRASIEAILRHYETVQVISSGGQDDIHRMEKRISGTRYRKSELIDELPDILFVKAALLGQFKGYVDDSTIPF
jgi:hypothetical protein